MKRLLALCVGILMTAVATAQTPLPTNAAASAALQAIVVNPAKPLASLSVVAVRNGEVAYEGHFGYRYVAADPDSKNIAPDHDTLYRIASVSKMVTTIGAMRLVDAGRLDLDADISQYLGFKVRNPHFADVPITTRMLLSHTSSLRDDAGYFFPLSTSLQSVLDRNGTNYGKGEAWAVPGSHSDRAPGRFFEYVNLNFGVVGTVIEAISQQRFDLYMQTQVLKPLGIVGGYTPETLGQDEANNLAVLYRKGTEELWNTSGPWVPQVDDYRGKLPPPRSGLNAYVPGTNATGFGPQGGLRISVAGLAKIMQMLMNAGVVGDVRILRPESVRAMAQAQWQHRSGQNNGDTLNGIFHSWGLGMQRFEDISGPATGDRLVAKGGITGVGHLGEAYGLNSGFIYDPVSRNGVIFAIGGTGTDPEKDKGQYSSFQSWEEGILDVLFGVAMQVHQPGAN